MGNVEFSICLASFNGEKYIGDQLNSILSQIGLDDEIVISDNGSCDGTLKIIKSLDDKRIKVLNCSTVGVVKNFENSLKNASGRYIVLCDQDDIWREGRLRAARNALKVCDLSVVGMIIVNEDLEPIELDGKSHHPSTSFLMTLYSNGFSGCSLAFRRQVLDLILPFPNRLPMHDWWIALIVIALKKKVIIDKNKYILYRRHKNNVSSTGEKSCLSFKRRLYMRLFLSALLLQRVLEIGLKYLIKRF